MKGQNLGEAEENSSLRSSEKQAKAKLPSFNKNKSNNPGPGALSFRGRELNV
jgi:hypothetical protein